MDENIEQTMEDQDQYTTPEASQAREEVSETPSPLSNEVPPAHEGYIGSDFFDQEAEWAATAIGQTPEGKTVQVVKRPDGSGYMVNFREGGEKAPEMDGWFTNYSKAEEAARLYLNRRLEENK